MHPTASERSACSLCPSGYSRCSRRQAPWRSFGSCTFWFVAGSSRETLGEGRAGSDGRSPARPERRRGGGVAGRKNPTPPLHRYRPIKQARSYAPQSEGLEPEQPRPDRIRIGGEGTLGSTGIMACCARTIEGRDLASVSGRERMGHRTGQSEGIGPDIALALLLSTRSGFPCCCAGFRHTRPERWSARGSALGCYDPAPSSKETQ